MIPSFAVIPTSNRPQVCLRSIGAIAPQVDVVYVVDNGDQTPMPDPPDTSYINYYPIRYDRQGQIPNLSLIWNLGLEQIAADMIAQGFEQWDVAILNDDAIVPEGWFDAVSKTMRQMGGAAGCSGGRSPFSTINVRPGPVPLHTRLFGPAFIVAGEKGLRADERLKWWAGDDDLDWTARQNGGMVMIPGYQVQHLHPDGQWTPALQAQAGQDMETFAAKWGQRPW